MWAFSKRILLFVFVNILIMITMTVVVNLICAFLGITPDKYLSYILILSVVMGFGGAFMSLLLSKWTAKRMLGVQVIDLQNSDPVLRNLVTTVHNLAKAARLPAMPEVGVYDSNELNAFATGPSKSNSLVAVSTGLLRRMRPEEVEGVLGHEISHIANGDMVTMTLLQGVINAVVIFLARIIANIVSNSGRDSNSRSNPFIYIMTVMLLETVFSLLGLIVVNYFSRAREFRADSGGARFAGREKMISALRALQGTTDYLEKDQAALNTLKISGKPRTALMAIFSTHPPLEERIRRLETGR